MERDERIQRIVRWWARWTVRAGGLGERERTDVEQTLWEDLHRRRGRFDPRRGSWTAFARLVVRRRAYSLLASLGEPSIPSVVDPVDASPDHREVVDRRLDVEEVIADMPPRERELCLALMQEPISTAAASVGIARSTAYVWLRRLRLRFAAAGLSPDSFGHSDRSSGT